ncbi:MAG: carbohydrate ABC transporter permease [Alphaproteobacteria bacterium]|jgi:multiple sugar transport system permease protein|nr:carbohydrate ABC transporter permease [Alphaproteobacteria bacterium]|tara:strand:- start:1323 stop:2516 length:1194 start_codon:yes stop_codon:yes gene_type:complete
MKTKNIIIFSIISSFFLVSLISIWKILVTLQGIKLENFNFQIIFLLGFLVSLAHVIIGNKLNIILKLIIFSLIFIFIDGYLIQSMPIWYNIGVFLILYFFINKIKKFNNKILEEEHSTQIIIFDFLTLFGIVLFSFVILFPFYMMVVTSFKTQIALLVNPLDFSINFAQGFKDLFKSYFVIFKSYKFGKYILTSTIVSLGTVFITLVFAIPAAYAIARLNFFGKTFLSTSILIIYMFPAIVLVIPLYTVFSQLGLRNSIEGLLIVYTATTLPVAIYMLQGYFKSIPKELEEAAILDKLSWFGIITKIIIPLSIPAISSVALYVFMIAWNEFLFSLMFLDNPNSFTLSRAIQYLSGDAETPRQYLMAGSVIVTLPVLFIFVYFEKYLVSGLTAGSVKG